MQLILKSQLRVYIYINEVVQYQDQWSYAWLVFWVRSPHTNCLQGKTHYCTLFRTKWSLRGGDSCTYGYRAKKMGRINRIDHLRILKSEKFSALFPSHSKFPHFDIWQVLLKIHCHYKWPYTRYNILKSFIWCRSEHFYGQNFENLKSEISHLGIADGGAKFCSFFSSLANQISRGSGTANKAPSCTVTIIHAVTILNSE